METELKNVMETEQQVNILLVDDRQDNLLVMETILADLGQNLICVNSGREALRFLLNEEVAVILLDVQMPGLDGFETAELIRGRERMQHTPIIFVTAVNKSEESIFQGYSLGAVDYITKPFEPVILRSKVKFFIDFYRQKLSIQRQGELLAQANRELDGLNAELEARVLERTAQLQAANRELEAEIVERKRIGEELRISEERLHKIFLHSNDAIFVLDSQRNMVLEANPRACNMFGYTREEILATPLYEFHPKDLERFAAFIQSVTEEGHGWTDQFACRAKDGHFIASEISASTLVIDDRMYILALVRDITKRKRAEEQIKASLKEKEVLLKEIHHRVKNNLQIVSSLLNLQSRHIKNEGVREEIKESQDRVKSMALIHEKLYQSKDLSGINFADYVKSLSSYLFSSYGVNSNIKLKTDMDDVLVDIDRAIPCGLIVNEIVSNALKHAFSDGRTGEISIKFSSDNGNHTLIINNDGAPFPEDVDFRNTESLGLQLVCALTEQLRGTIELDKSSGTEFRIKFSPG